MLGAISAHVLGGPGSAAGSGDYDASLQAAVEAQQHAQRPWRALKRQSGVLEIAVKDLRTLYGSPC